MPNANQKNISINTANIVGTEDNLNTSMTTTRISELGFTLACANSKVSGKTVNITFYYS